MTDDDLFEGPARPEIIARAEAFLEALRGVDTNDALNALYMATMNVVAEHAFDLPDPVGVWREVLRRWEVVGRGDIPQAVALNRGHLAAGRGRP